MLHPFTYLLTVATLGLPGQWWVTAVETRQLAKANAYFTYFGLSS